MTPLCPCGEPLDDTPCWRDSALNCPDCPALLCGRRCLREHISKNHRDSERALLAIVVTCALLAVVSYFVNGLAVGL
jgi:hypothetical protein